MEPEENRFPPRFLLLASCFRFFRNLLAETLRISLTLFRIMVPVIIAVKLLQEFGAVVALGRVLSPAMRIVGLPGSMGLVWATTILSNIYTGIVVFVSVSANEPLTVAQTTVLGTMMLVAHSLPVELRIAQKAGTRLRFMVLVRMGGAFLLGWALFSLYSWAGVLQEQNTPVWFPRINGSSILTWAAGQARGLIMIFFIIMGLLLVLRGLEKIGITTAMTRLLAPVLKLLGIGPSACTITVIGMTLGIGYGGGLIIQESVSGRVERKDVLFSLTLMGLCHSLFEDTLAVAITGAHFSGTLWARFIFSITVVFLLVRLISRLSEKTLNSFFLRPACQGQELSTE
jgi:hypothetical protein